MQKKAAVKWLTEEVGGEVTEKLIKKGASYDVVKAVKKLKKAGIGNEVIGEMADTLSTGSIKKLGTLANKGMSKEFIEALARNADVLDNVSIKDLLLFKNSIHSADEIIKRIQKDGYDFIEEYRKFGDEVFVVIVNSYDEFRKAASDIGTRTDLTDLQKVKELQKLFARSNYKTDINVPSDIQYVKGFDANGNVIYDWPPKLGFDENTIKSISRIDGLPDTWDRYGYMGGSNFADVPSAGKYTYSERSIPYVVNEAAYHTGIFNNATYFDKIDAIKNKSIDIFNDLLQNEGILKWELDDFEELCDSYDSFILKISQELGDNIDATYGIKGTAAGWGDMSGGAGQIVTPFGGDVLEKIGILVEK